MNNKILEAVKVLGGNLNNIKFPDYSIGGKFLTLEDDKSYCVFVNKGRCNNIICTVDEFEQAASEWLKEAYMHNAAIDLDWDIKNSFYFSSEEYLFKNNHTGDYVDDDDNNEHGGDYTLICRSEEFTAYCSANKPKVFVVEKPLQWDGKGLPPIGTTVRFIRSPRQDEEEFVTIKYASDKYTVFSYNESGNEDCVVTGAVSFIPVKSPRNKAIQEMSKAMHSGDDAGLVNDKTLGYVYDWFKNLTPEQKEEFGL